MTQSGYVDWHCHLLPGLDDGPATFDESLEIGRILAAAGFRRIYCTPHQIKGLYAPSVPDVDAAAAELRTRFDRAGIPLTLDTGAEHYLDEYILSLLSEPRSLGSSRRILLEVPQSGTPVLVQETVFKLVVNNITPIIAHPERSGLFAQHQSPGSSPLTKLLASWNGKLREKGGKVSTSPAGNLAPGTDLVTTLREMGCLFQGNIGSFAGRYGDRERRQALLLLERGAYSCLGSDAHHARDLERWLERGIREIERAVGRDAARRLMGEESPGTAGDSGRA